MKMRFILAAAAALTIATAAEAAPIIGASKRALGGAQDAKNLVEARGGRGGWSYYGAGPNYYQQQHPGPNCYPEPHPVYGWICY